MPRMDAVILPKSNTLTAVSDRPAGEESLKAIGSHSNDTFRTARATPASGSVREKATDRSTSEAE